MKRDLKSILIFCTILMITAFFAGRCTGPKKDCAPLDEALLSSIDSLEFVLDSTRKSFAVALIDNSTLKEKLKDQPIRYKYITKVQTDSRLEQDIQLIRDSLYQERSEVKKKIAAIKQQQYYDSLSLNQIISDAIMWREKYDSLEHAYNASHFASISDKWINADFVFTPPDQLGVDASLYDEITLVQKEERSGLFGQKRSYFVDAYNANPYVTELKVKSFKIIEKPRRFGLGPYIGGGISNQGTFSVQAGVGLHYSLIKF